MVKIEMKFVNGHLDKHNDVIHDATKVDYFLHFGVVNYKHNEEYCKAFGVHLRKLRENKGIGMRQFALMADMEYSQLSKIERGVTNPTISTVLALAAALGVSHTDLYDFRFVIKEIK
jgi:DNA-binding XRE family transcriptional regulator